MTNHPEPTDFERLKDIGAEIGAETDACLLADELASANIGLEIFDALAKDVATELDDACDRIRQMAERLREHTP